MTLAVNGGLLAESTRGLFPAYFACLTTIEGCAYLVKADVREFDGPCGRATNVPAFDVAVSRSRRRGLVDANVHRDWNVHFAFAQHSKCSLDAFNRMLQSNKVFGRWSIRMSHSRIESTSTFGCCTTPWSRSKCPARTS